MSSGPEHYAEAESLLEQADGWLNGEDAADSFEFVHTRRAEDLAAAQVHATLALAAATWFADPAEGATDMAKEWWAVAGEPGSSYALPGTVWWLDDGHENPGAPELYLTQPAALAAGVKQFRDDNFDQQDAQLSWTLFEEENGEGSLELVAVGRCTGIIVRPLKPKAAADA